jgi:CBS domain containing-hemolysin-like protein
VFDAAWRPDELFDRAGVTVPDDGDYDTVGGFLADQLDRIPELGDEVAIAGGVLRIDRVDGVRVHRVRYTPVDPETDPSLATPHDRIVSAIKKDLIHE